MRCASRSRFASIASAVAKRIRARSRLVSLGREYPGDREGAPNVLGTRLRHCGYHLLGKGFRTSIVESARTSSPAIFIG